MPLQQLVEYFNDRLEQEHNAGFRPFILNKHKVEGLFGPIRVGTQLNPIRTNQPDKTIIGHAAQLKVSANQSPILQATELDNLLDPQKQTHNSSESIINFDRLSRSVHMLNYLPQSHRDELLFLDVDPRHILGVKTDHGAYFEEVIGQCGLQTSNVTISMTVNGLYSRFYHSLLKGLANYQRRGYRIALKFDYQSLDKSTFDLIVKAAPDFVGVFSINLDRLADNNLTDKLQQLTTLTHSINAKSLLLNIDDRNQTALAENIGFNLLQGDYIETITANV